MRHICIDARGLGRFARFQHLPARAWTIAIVLASLVSAESAASSGIDPDSLVVRRDKIILPSGSVSSLPSEAGADSSAATSATVSAPESGSPSFSDAYWSAISELDLSASRNAARSGAESSFAEAMTMLAAGELASAENAFAKLSKTATDINVAMASQILLARTLMYEHEWAKLRDMVPSSALTAVDRAATAVLEQWGRAFSNIEPQLTSFPGSAVTLPLRMTSVGTPAIRVRINGREYEFWLDTGSTMTVVSSEVAAAARIPIVAAETLQVRTFAGVARVRPALVRTIQVGEIRLINVPAIVIDKSMMRIKTGEGGPTSGYRVDGILGWDFIRQFEVVLDFENGVVTLSKPEKLGIVGTAAQNLVWMGEPMVQVRAKDGVTLHLALDTGAQSSFMNATVLGKLGSVTRPATARVAGIAMTGTATSRMIPSLSLDIAGRSIRLEDVIVYGPTYSSLIACDGVLGSDVAEHGVIKIDATNGIFSVG
jgi:predicted aspartyl protease